MNANHINSLVQRLLDGRLSKITDELERFAHALGGKHASLRVRIDAHDREIAALCSEVEALRKQMPPRLVDAA